MSEDDVVEMPMFPLGTVLFPAMPLPLRIFEDRYVAMLQDLLQRETPDFGVVLIERGHEVGGGDHRFDRGTVARVTQVVPQAGAVSVMAQGTRRLDVVEWLPDDPYPRARVRLVPDLRWTDAYRPARDGTEALVRRTLARASEFDDQRWTSNVELSHDPVHALWQLAAIAPVTALDQLRLLAADDVPDLLERVQTATREAAATLDAWR